MKRLLTLLVCGVTFAAPSAGRAQATTVTFDDAVPFAGSYSTGPYTIGGRGMAQPGTFEVFGDGWNENVYLLSSGSFFLHSLDANSMRAAPDQVYIMGYLTSTIEAWLGSPSGLLGASLPAALAQGGVTPDYTFAGYVDLNEWQTITLDWSDLRAVAFTDFGGRPPHDVDPTGFYTYNYLIDNIQVVATPEPASLALFATGLFGLMGVRRFRHS